MMDTAIVLVSPRHVAVVDLDDLELINQRTWRYCGQYAAAASRKADREQGARFNIYLHRLVMGEAYTSSPYIDHENQNKLDCRKSNLRPATRGQNSANVSLRPNTTTGYRGVWKRQGNYSKPWVARIVVNCKCINLGHHATPEEAALAYNEAALLHFGEFAVMNEVKSGPSQQGGVSPKMADGTSEGVSRGGEGLPIQSNRRLDCYVWHHEREVL